MKYLIRLKSNLFDNYETTSFLFPNPWEEDLSENAIVRYYDGTFILERPKLKRILLYGSFYQLLLIAKSLYGLQKGDDGIPMYYFTMIEYCLVFLVKRKKYKKMSILLKVVDCMSKDAVDRMLFESLMLPPRFIKAIVSAKLGYRIIGDSSVFEYPHFNFGDVLDMLPNIRFENLKYYKRPLIESKTHIQLPVHYSLIKDYEV